MHAYIYSIRKIRRLLRTDISFNNFLLYWRFILNYHIIYIFTINLNHEQYEKITRKEKITPT